MGADGVEVILGEGFHRQGTVSRAALLPGIAKYEVVGVWMNQRVVSAEGIAGLARPRVVDRIASHAKVNLTPFQDSVSGFLQPGNHVSKPLLKTRIGIQGAANGIHHWQELRVLAEIAAELPQ